MWRAGVVGAVAGAVLGACGGLGGGAAGATGQTLGTLNGKSFVVGASAAGKTSLILSEDSQLCDPTGSYALAHPGTRITVVELLGTLPDGGSCIGGWDRCTVGEWTVGDQKADFRIVAVPGGSCDAGRPDSSSSLPPGTYIDPNSLTGGKGTVTVEALTPNLRGRIKVTLENGSTLEGAFEAPYCSADTSPTRCVER